MQQVNITAAAPADRRLAEALAEEMVSLTGRLASLAFDLGQQPETLRRHMHSLQAIDLITQTQLALAEMLRSHTPVEERIDAITLADLAERMRSRLG